MGHCAMLVLRAEQMVGWVNLSVVRGQLNVDLGFVGAQSHSPAFERALEPAVQAFRAIMGL